MDDKIEGLPEVEGAPPTEPAGPPPPERPVCHGYPHAIWRRAQGCYVFCGCGGKGSHPKTPTKLVDSLGSVCKVFIIGLVHKGITRVETRSIANRDVRGV
jgi:hypothetical protein